MNASVKLNSYISAFTQRWRQLVLGKGLVITVAVFTLISLLAAYIALQAGFDNAYFWTGRIFLLVATAIVAYLFLVRPLKQLPSNVSTELEQRGPSFSGRIHTFRDSEQAESIGGLHELLAADALNISESEPQKALLSNQELRLPYFLTGLVTLLLIVMLAIGPGMMNHSLRYLYAGWAFSDLLPPQSIEVAPGDVLVKRGGNITLTAKAVGFKSEQLILHVKNGDNDWQEVEMSRLPGSDDEYDFSLFSIRDSIDYYIASSAVRTPNYGIDVIDLPGISSITMTYRYPDWTQLDDETVNSIGDIAVLPGTQVDVAVFTDSALPAGELVVNGESVALSMDNSAEQPRGSASFTVDEAGDYFLAGVIGGDQVRLTDDYFISVLEDQRPEIEFTFPMRDWNASNIEEVLTEVSVTDDFGIEQVELVYAINGGEWTTLNLKQDDFDFVKDEAQTVDHLFYLEDMLNEEEAFSKEKAFSKEEAVSDIGSVDPLTAVVSNEIKPLQPGDLISYYAKVSDRQNTEQTDIFFIEVQPFDRRFSQAEQGGGMAGGQGESELEISQRQREIIVSTWNLIREQNDGSLEDQDLIDRLADSTKLLAQLQDSLAEQAQSLIETARSRQLTADQRIETYTRHIEKAIEAMQPASERLAEVQLSEAIGPEQIALQHLLRADAVFNEIQVSLNNGGGGGQGGGQASEELAEMFELEIDMDRNQYETGSRASLSEEAQETDETAQALEDLARRQQQLANNLRNNNQITEAERYQQELLRREAEQLEQRINDLQEQASTQGQGQGQTQQQEPGANQGDAGEETGLPQDLTASELNRRLQSAMDAMDRASDSMRSGDIEQLQRDAGEAQRQLQGAGEQLSEDQRNARIDDFTEMAETATELYQEQIKMEERLLDGVEQAIANADPLTERISSPFTYSQERDMAEQKVNMVEGLQRLKSNMVTTASQLKSELPRVARILETADARLKESEVATRMNMASEYMRRGEALYVANSEGITTNALRSLNESTQQALRELTSQEAGEQSALDQILSDLREGRSQMQEIAEQVQSSLNEAEGSAQGEPGSELSDNEQELAQGSPPGQAQPGQDGQQGAEPGAGGQGQDPGQAGNGANPVGGNQGGGNNAGADWNGWTATRGFSPDLSNDLNRQLSQALSEANNLMPELRDRGVAEENLDTIRELVQQLQNRELSGALQDPSLQELNSTLALLEELEARVDSSLQGNNNKVRTQAPEVIPDEYREAVANYYRRLSDDSPDVINEPDE